MEIVAQDRMKAILMAWGLEQRESELAVGPTEKG